MKTEDDSLNEHASAAPKPIDPTLEERRLVAPSGHSPGPWRLVQLGHGSMVVADGDTLADPEMAPRVPRIVARTDWGRGEEDEANARLIVVGANCHEELLKALKEMREVCAACFRVIVSRQGLTDVAHREFISAGLTEGFGVRAEDAIARAESLAQALNESGPAGSLATERARSNSKKESV